MLAPHVSEMNGPARLGGQPFQPFGSKTHPSIASHDDRVQITISDRDETDTNGRIDITCDADASTVRISVRDTGIGIPADRLETIFEPFVQINRSLTRQTEGTGLGLAISRDLARGMHGDLTVESTPGVGLTFTLSLPRG